MKIEELGFNGYQLRQSQGKWYFDLWNLGRDLKLRYGPFTYAEAEEWIAANPDKVDWDRELTRQKITRENTSL